MAEQKIPNLIPQNNSLARVRIVEERINTLNKKTEIIEDNLLQNSRNIQKEIDVISQSIRELNIKVSKAEQQIGLMIKELEITADKKDVEKLQKYLDLWNPLHFVTLKEVQKIIDEKLGEKNGTQ